jgi:DNA polymerase/3'-5' exonuclease PolX
MSSGEEHDVHTQSSNKRRPMNDEIIGQLEKLLKQFEMRGDQSRKIEFQKALSFMKSYSKPIEDVDQIEEEMPNIGDFVRDKLKEFFSSGFIKDDSQK